MLQSSPMTLFGIICFALYVENYGLSGYSLVIY